MRSILKWMLILLLGYGIYGCREKSMPLDEKQFTALLIDMHKVDGILAVDRGRNYNELKNYAYYNDLFRKYGITRAEFDTCMYYYSARTVPFSKMYDAIIDTLNRQLTTVDKVLNELKSKDSVNYFPVLDTLRLDSVFSITLDSIVPGLYKFGTTIQFDSIPPGRSRRITSFFLSGDGKDTLKVRDITVNIDTLKRNYYWSQYADSTYSRLVITFLDTLPPLKLPKPVKGRKTPSVKKEKEVKLELLGGKAWDTQLFRPYISRETERRLKQTILRR